MAPGKDYTTICAGAAEEVLALVALGAREALLSRSQAILRDNLERIDEFMHARRHQVSWIRPRAGSIGFPRLEAPVAVDDLAETLVTRHGVMLAPGSLFGFEGNHFRLGLGRRSFPAALEAFAAGLDEVCAPPGA